jgi:hypothetical protein
MRASGEACEEWLRALEGATARPERRRFACCNELLANASYTKLAAPCCSSPSSSAVLPPRRPEKLEWLLLWCRWQQHGGAGRQAGHPAEGPAHTARCYHARGGPLTCQVGCLRAVEGVPSMPWAPNPLMDRKTSSPLEVNAPGTHLQLGLVCELFIGKCGSLSDLEPRIERQATLAWLIAIMADLWGALLGEL